MLKILPSRPDSGTLATEPRRGGRSLFTLSQAGGTVVPRKLQRGPTNRRRPTKSDMIGWHPDSIASSEVKKRTTRRRETAESRSGRSKRRECLRLRADYMRQPATFVPVASM